MTIVDKRTAATKEFGELPIGAVFELPASNGQAEWFGICMKINSANRDNNAIDLEDCHLFSMPPNEEICELNAHLVIEGR